MPVHIFFGLLGFVLAIAAALLGISEKAFFSMPDYKDMPSGGLLVNCIGILMVVFGSFVAFLVTEPSYKREPLPEDAMLLSSAQD
jgi:cytochrome b-561